MAFKGLSVKRNWKHPTISGCLFLIFQLPLQQLVTLISDMGLTPAKRCWVKNLSLIHSSFSWTKASYWDGRRATSWGKQKDAKSIMSESELKGTVCSRRQARENVRMLSHICFWFDTLSLVTLRERCEFCIEVNFKSSLLKASWRENYTHSC